MHVSSLVGRISASDHTFGANLCKDAQSVSCSFRVKDLKDHGVGVTAIFRCTCLSKNLAQLQAEYLQIYGANADALLSTVFNLPGLYLVLYGAPPSM